MIRPKLNFGGGGGINGIAIKAFGHVMLCKEVRRGHPNLSPVRDVLNPRKGPTQHRNNFP